MAIWTQRLECQVYKKRKKKIAGDTSMIQNLLWLKSIEKQAQTTANCSLSGVAKASFPRHCLVPPIFIYTNKSSEVKK